MWLVLMNDTETFVEINRENLNCGKHKLSQILLSYQLSCFRETKFCTTVQRRFEVSPWHAFDPVKEFPGLFSGLGKAKQSYCVKINPNAAPCAVNIPRRVSLPLKVTRRALLNQFLVCQNGVLL